MKRVLGSVLISKDDIQRRIMERSGMIMPSPLAGRALLWPNVKNLWLGVNAEPYRATAVWLDS